jgi:hypothetical protein
MNTDFEREVSAAFHCAADQLPAPRLDLDAIRRAGRRRRVTSFTVAVLAAAVLAGGAATAVLHLPSAPSRAAGRPGASASPRSYAASPPTRAASPHPSATRPRPSATSPAVPAAAMADVRAFYSGYPAAARQGQATVDSFIGTYTASWYAPIAAEALAQPGAPGDCFNGHDGLDYVPAGLLGGQAIIVVSSSDAAGQFLYAIVTADQSTGKITGLACASGGQSPINAAYARTYASSLYGTWLTLRRQGDSPQEATARMVGYYGGPESASPYLNELGPALWPELTYDPLLCTSVGIPDVSVTAVTVVADGSAGVVELTPSVGQPIVAVWVLSSKGFAVASVACHQP